MLNLTLAQRSELEQLLAELDVEEPGNSLSDFIRVMVLGDSPATAAENSLIARCRRIEGKYNG